MARWKLSRLPTCERVIVAPSARLRLPVLNGAELPGIGPGLSRRLNRPGWPAVRIETVGDTLVCTADTWEPILRARVEDAVDELLGSIWRESIQWV
jgi:hypothetical protein